MAYKIFFYNQDKSFNFSRRMQEGFVKLPVFLIAGLVVILAVILLLLPGTGRKDGSNQIKVNEGQPQGFVSIPSSKGELPEGFPEELVAYESPEIISGEDATYKGVNQKIVVLKVADSMEEASAFYKQSLPKLGWILTDEIPGDEITELKLIKGDKKFEVLITPQDQGSQVRLNLTSSTSTNSTKNQKTD